MTAIGVALIAQGKPADGRSTLAVGVIVAAVAGVGDLSDWQLESAEAVADPLRHHGRHRTSGIASQRLVPTRHGMGILGRRRYFPRGWRCIVGILLRHIHEARPTQTRRPETW